MDIKLKSSSRWKRRGIGALLIALIAGLNIAAFLITMQYMWLGEGISWETGITGAVGQIWNEVCIFFYLVSMLLVGGAVFYTTDRRFWQDIDDQLNGPFYVGEIALIGLVIVGLCIILYPKIGLVIVQDRLFVSENYMAEQHRAALLHQLNVLLKAFFKLYLLYGFMYLTFYFIRPLFSLGIRRYIRQYSLGYLLWKRLLYEAGHVDLRQKSDRIIIAAVIINGAVLAVLWFLGPLSLLPYSAALFLAARYCYNRVSEDYRKLLQVTGRIAETDFSDMEVTEDLGIFNPFKDELDRIGKGFSHAVSEEIRSQRMKTELIANVSHDLKTPLTAITTYAELLKKDDITEEERRGYIETLENKSLRLKALIEDLFEISKASSGTAQLHCTELDLVNLLKQISVEHAEKYEELGLTLRWRLPKEKVIVRLDSLKTYRIFENLFTNVQKYAMPNTRVYVDVALTGSLVQIAVKNISGQEITVSPQELTERFVRGDTSRNTDGFGLGLAIVKSFVELQQGEFSLNVDGDLFKTVICFPRGDCVKS